MQFSLSIIIVNWNTQRLLRNCLASVLESDLPYPYEVIVVDNDSHDGSVDMVSVDFPQVRLIKNEENVGFAKANNQAISTATGSFVCLLNSDTVVGRNCLSIMLDFLRDQPKVVACAPALRLPDTKLQTGAAGYPFSISSVFNYSFFLSKLLPKFFKGIYLDQNYFVGSKVSVEVGWVAGACMMVSKSAIEKVGKLDESSHMYAEDVEWCDRLRNVGAVHYLPFVEILHYHGASSDKVSTTWIDASLMYFKKRRSSAAGVLFALIFSAGLGLRASLYSFLTIFDRSKSAKAGFMFHYYRYSLSKVFG